MAESISSTRCVSGADSAGEVQRCAVSAPQRFSIVSDMNDASVVVLRQAN